MSLNSNLHRIELTTSLLSAQRHHPETNGAMYFQSKFTYICPKVTQTSKELKKLKVQKIDLAGNQTEVIRVIAGTFTAEPLVLI
jgi:hypothetical protein